MIEILALEKLDTQTQMNIKMDIHRKLNGFNNGRDASSGVGGGKSSFEMMREEIAELKKLFAKDIKIQGEENITGRGLIFIVDLTENDYDANQDFQKVINEDFSKGQTILVKGNKYIVQTVEGAIGMRGLKPLVGIVVKPDTKNMITIEVPEGSFIASPYDSKEESKLKFKHWIKDTYENK